MGVLSRFTGKPLLQGMNHPQINKQLFYGDGKAPFEVTDPRRSEVTDYSRSLQDGSETGGPKTQVSRKGNTP